MGHTREITIAVWGDGEVGDVKTEVFQNLCPCAFMGGWEREMRKLTLLVIIILSASGHVSILELD